MKIRPIIPKIAANYGLVGGLLTVVAFITFFYLGHQPWRNLISFILDTLIIGIFCFLPMKEFKSHHNAGSFRFYHGMTLGFVSYLMISFVFAIFYFLFTYWIEPSFLELYKEIQKEDMKNLKELIMSTVEEGKEEHFQKQLNGINDITRSQLILDVFLKKAIIGLVLTPIFSIILRTQPTR